MKTIVLSAIAAVLLSTSVQAQSTVDSIAAKYKMVPMPEALTIEKTFPVLGTYQLNAPATADASTTTASTNTATTTTSATDVASTTTSSDVAAAPSTITITLDSANKGMVWVDGLPQGRLKAYLKKSPSTYRIIEQKTEGGTQVPEGTLIFDPATQTLNIALGKAFDDVDPAAVFAALNTVGTSGEEVEVKVKTQKSKTKTKLTFYSATKLGATNSSETTTASDSTQTQQTEQTQQAPAQQNQQ